MRHVINTKEQKKRGLMKNRIEIVRLGMNSRKARQPLKIEFFC
jgi:hypothetical protein